MPEVRAARAISGRGEEIFEKMLKPSFKDAYQYDRVASYYDPHSLTIILAEISQIWKRGGTVRLVIGFHERMNITPALRDDLEIRQAIKAAVARAIMGQADELIRLLSQEENKRELEAIREMINKDALHVRLVTPKVNFEYYKKMGVWPDPEKATFHSKFMIIHHADSDSKGSGATAIARAILRRLNRQYYQPSSLRLRRGERFSVITGSMNETKRGYTENIEDAVLHRSWVENEKPICKYFLDRFERLWIDTCDDVISMPFSDEFGALVREVHLGAGLRRFSWDTFAETVTNSPVYHGIAFPGVGLLPHQVGAYAHALGRWPIRVLLADEVGLGKTIEAGSVISYLTRFCGVKRVLILTPASLRRQWQTELQEAFGMEFWVYDPSEETCAVGDRKEYVGRAPLAYKDKIDKVIVSWHWARIGVDDESFRFDTDSLPDLLIVDEAHHARIRDTGSGESETQLFKLLRKLQQHIPHVVLLTATPYQTDLLDYYSLLEILGVPEGFRRELEVYAGWARGEIHSRFALWVRQLKSVHEFVQTYRLQLGTAIPGDLEETPLQNSTRFYEDIVRATGEVPHDIVIATHPATFLAVRNYRSSLRNLGYSFPEPVFRSPDIPISDEQREFLDDVEEYVRDLLGHPEKALGVKLQIGLMRSLYRQRMVSSIRAAHDTLNRRREKLTRFIDRGSITELKADLSDELGPSTNDENDAISDEPYTTIMIPNLEYIIDHARTERHRIERLLARIPQSFQQEEALVDPKMIVLKEVVGSHLSEGRQVLVFSRFTSTTAAILDELRQDFGNIGIGRFDGEHVGIFEPQEKALEFRECTRKEIVSYLKRGLIRIMVCSDAASEGLNLHSANVVINVDVPWNPARLLQRFGRVDRLGQKAKEVFLVNLYYPHSIEEQMYKVLEDRRTDFRAVLGEVPEIMSRQQKKVISDLESGAKPSVNVTLEEIQHERSEYLRNQIVGTESTGVGRQSARSLYSSLIGTLAAAAESAGRKVEVIGPLTIKIDGTTVCLDPLDDDFISLGNASLSEYENPSSDLGRRVTLCQLEDESGVPLCFVLADGDSLIPITSRNWSALFDYCFKGEPLEIDALKRFPTDRIDGLMTYLRESESWIWPNHGRMKCLSEMQIPMPMFEIGKVGKKLGYATVRSESLNP